VLTMSRTAGEKRSLQYDVLPSVFRAQGGLWHSELDVQQQQISQLSLAETLGVISTHLRIGGRWTAATSSFT
jgi:hypothetical protein